MKPWTIRVTVPGAARKPAYAMGMPRYWTKWGAQRKCRKLNKVSAGLGYWYPVRTREEAW